jgi:DNA-3-methyladenine glycosylase II
MRSEDQISEAEKELEKLDPILGKLIKMQKPITHKHRTDYFYSLCSSIISQQISTAAAAAVFGRFDAATNCDPEKILSLSDEEMRAIGLSRQKTSYIRDIAQHFAEDPKIYEHLDKLGDDEVAEELIKLKGIGAWTAQMFLMFTLVRLDIFAPDDVGIQRAMKKLYGWDELPEREELIKIADKWRPYRTVACWHLWRSLNNTPDNG